MQCGTSTIKMKDSRTMQVNHSSFCYETFQPMKNFLALIVCTVAILVCQSAYAQIKGGLRLGLSTFDVPEEVLRFSNGNGLGDLAVSLDQANYNFHFGGWLRFGGGVYIQPEFLLNSSKQTYNLEDLGSVGTYTGLFTETYLHLDLPLLIGLKLGPLRLNAGPVGHVLLDATVEEQSVPGFQKDFRDLTLGWQGGIGFDIGRLTLDVRYEGNFDSFGDSVQIGSQTVPFTDRPSRVIGAIGYIF